MLPQWLEKALLNTVDALYATVPRKAPTAQRAQQVHIISHRGERDSDGVVENTLAAFDPLVGSGIWGVEFDVRWSRDLLPVVIHDPSALRGYGIDIRASDFSRDEFLEAVPSVPTLESFVERYGQEFHLMMELKPEHYPEPALQADMLRTCLGSLQPVRDYHLMSLDPELLLSLPGFPRECLVPIARFNIREISDVVAGDKFGGIGGHYLLFTDSKIRRHKSLGQKIGIGFPDSRFSLYREINRGVDWVFSNRALEMEKIRQSLASG